MDSFNIDKIKKRIEREIKENEIEIIEEYGSLEAYEIYLKKDFDNNILRAKMKTYNQALLDSNIPVKYLNSCIRFSDDNTKYLAEMKKHTFIYLRGKLGRGKTSLVCSYLRLGIVLFMKNYGCDDYPHFVAEYKPYFLKCHSLELYDLNDLKKYLSQCSKKQVLVIDDIGFVKSNDFIRRNVASMILERMDNGQKTIITSNESMTNVFDERIVNKMKEDFKMISIDGENLRGNK